MRNRLLFIIALLASPALAHIPATHTLVRSGDFTDSRSYDYATLSRRLTAERLNLDASTRWTNTFTYDAGSSAGLGVLTGNGQPSGGGWSGGVDAHFRMTAETNSVIRRSANGRVNGEATVHVNLDGQPLPVTLAVTNSSSWAYMWRTTMELASGPHQLEVIADHPGGSFTTNATVTFTNNAANEVVTETYDGRGKLTQRIWKSPSGTTNRIQTLGWDALGRLWTLEDLDADENGNYYNWYYDPLNRRVFGYDFPMQDGVPVEGPGGALDVHTGEFYFDPQAEFLELGQRRDYEPIAWKVYGPDLDGRYSGLNGTGGFEAAVGTSGQFEPLISDARGNVLGAVTNGVVVWSDARVTGYGAVPGHRPLPLWHGGDVAAASAWRGRWVDASGYVWLGARFYDLESGRFIDADPVWNGRDPNYYTFAGGDPINYFDADGRFGKGALQGRESTWNGNGIPDGNSGAFDAGYWIGRSAAQVGQTISRIADSAWNLFWGATSQENVAQAFASSEMASPMGNWFNAYPDTAASHLWVDQFTSEIAPAAQQMIMAVAARPGVQSVPVSQPSPRATQWGAQVEPAYNGQRAGVQPVNTRQQPVVTVLGSGRDVAQYASQPGFNVLRIPQNIPRNQWDAYNEYWLMNAYTRGDSFWLVTDPVSYEQVLRNANRSPSDSAYFRVELPILDSFNVRQNAVPAYVLPGGPPNIVTQQR